jgi:hypothetical protein
MSTDTGDGTEEVEPTAFLEDAREHLLAALEESDPTEKDYHVRCALQACNVPTDD